MQKIKRKCNGNNWLWKKKEIIPLTHEENNFYNEQEICYICKEKFCMDKDDKDYISRKKVKDHCHYTGKFRGAATVNAI